MKSIPIARYAESLSPLHICGPRLEGDICRFTLHSRRAEGVELLLFDEPRDLRPSREVQLTASEHRFGDLWSVDVPGVKAGMCYVWKLDIPDSTFPADQWVLDPYAPAVAASSTWGQSLLEHPSHPRHTGRAFPKGVVVDSHFDWGRDTAPNLPWEDLIIYEAHVRGMTASPSSRVRNPGTYAGLIEKIPYLKSLGITAIELMPVYEFDEMEYFHTNDRRSSLRNFWGYSTAQFFAPMGRFSSAGVLGQQVNEFKSMVKAFHAAGMEVILDVVYNHTAENGQGGPVQSFKVLDESMYYITDPTHGFHNYSGCGNTVNCNHPVVRQFILDSLRHWVTEYHIDGFRFDLASILCRDTNGAMMGKPPLIEAIDEDPILRNTKMIAEAWDAAGAYQVGSFPSGRWAEWNGKYRDDLRSFWQNGQGRLSGFATRLLGSEDLYKGKKMGPLKSVNFICCHDGFTLRDLVSYERKHNEDNLEDNRDGDNNNHSQNLGVEGPTDDAEIRRTRLRLMKNMMASLLLSRGVPMFPAGDERGKTQKGSNNAYCQDNELSWIDWGEDAENKEMLAFTRKVIRLRKELPLLREAEFVTDGPRDFQQERVQWIGPEGRDPDWGQDWAIGLRLSGRAEVRGRRQSLEDVLMFFNGGTEPAKFNIPETDKCKWKLRLHTTEKRVHRSQLGTNITLPPRSVLVYSAPYKSSKK